MPHRPKPHRTTHKIITEHPAGAAQLADWILEQFTTPQSKGLPADILADYYEEQRDYTTADNLRKLASLTTQGA